MSHTSHMQAHHTQAYHIHIPYYAQINTIPQNTHTHTHTHTDNKKTKRRERDREKEREGGGREESIEDYRIKPAQVETQVTAILLSLKALQFFLPLSAWRIIPHNFLSCNINNLLLLVLSLIRVRL